MERYLKDLESKGNNVTVCYSTAKRMWTISICSKDGMKGFSASDPSLSAVLSMAANSTHFGTALEVHPAKQELPA